MPSQEYKYFSIKKGFLTLLQNNKDITVHQKNVQILMTEVYKIFKGEAPAIMKNLFISRENTHTIRNFQTTTNKNKNTVRYGLKSIYYRTVYLWADICGHFICQKKINIRKFNKKIRNM